MRLAYFAVLVAACSNGVMPSDVRSSISSDLPGVLAKAKELPQPAILGFLGITPAAIDSDATVKFLTEKVFTDSNFLGAGLYRLPPELACADGDTACVSKIAQAEARIRVASGDGTQFFVQLGADHDEPIAITLKSDELSLDLDLDNADAAMIALARASGETAPNVATAGELTADLVIKTNAKLTVSIERALGFAVADQGAPLDGDAAIRFAADPGTVTVDKNGTDIALGTIMMHAPGEDIAIAPATLTIADTVTGTFDMAITTTQTPAPYVTTHVALDGSLSASATQLALIAGSLALTTNPEAFGFIATAGDCVTAASFTDYTQYSVAACR